jgi:hypothetical protein
MNQSFLSLLDCSWNSVFLLKVGPAYHNTLYNIPEEFCSSYGT